MAGSPRISESGSQGVKTAKGISLRARLLELTDPDLTIRKYGPDLEMAAKSLDILNQCADADVGAVLDLRHFALMNAEDFTELQLCHLASFSKRVQGHRF